MADVTDRFAVSRHNHLMESGDLCELAGDSGRLFAVYRSVECYVGILPVVLENHVRAVFLGEGKQIG